MMSGGTWATFDDAFVLARMRDAAADHALDEADRAVLTAVLERQPPKVLLEREVLGDESEAGTHSSLVALANQKRDDWEREFNCRVWVWKQDTRMTKIGSQVPASVVSDSEDDSYEKLQQAVRVYEPETGGSHPLQEDRRSIIRTLSKRALLGVRVYALLPPDREADREGMTRKVDQDLLDFLR